MASFFIRSCNGTIWSAWCPIDSIENLKINTTWDGLFHSATYVFVVIGVFLLWRKAHLPHLY
jgi:uncharacterized membrane protein